MGQRNSKETHVKLPPLKKGREQTGGVLFLFPLLLLSAISIQAKQWHSEPPLLLTK